MLVTSQRSVFGSRAEFSFIRHRQIVNVVEMDNTPIISIMTHGCRSYSKKCERSKIEKKVKVSGNAVIRAGNKEVIFYYDIAT